MCQRRQVPQISGRHLSLTASPQRTLSTDFSKPHSAPSCAGQDQEMKIEERLAKLSARLTGRPARRERDIHADNPQSLVHVHHGWYVERGFLKTLRHEDRHLLRLIAVHRAAHHPPVFSHLSAAVLLDLPVYSRVDSLVHINVSRSGGRSKRNSAGVLRHQSPLYDHEVVTVQGMRCTSPERTVLDLCKSAPAETAIACADGFLRSEFRVHRAIDDQRLGEWRQDIDRLLHDQRGARGVRAAKRLLSLATPVTDSVLESVSHLQLRRLAFEVALQVPVPGPGGVTYFVDFELLGLRHFGECDGKQKYTDARFRNGKTADEVVYIEKRRSEWISTRTANGFVRWGYPEVPTALHFARWLHAASVPVPRWPR